MITRIIGFALSFEIINIVCLALQGLNLAIDVADDRKFADNPLTPRSSLRSPRGFVFLLPSFFLLVNILVLS
jgi:hypothetical protein